jgi:acyl-CoA reductase-like NAD-dependent aldehyde dehydrogenase
MIEEGRKALERAEIAGRAFADYNREQVMRIVRAVAAAAEENAERLAQEAVRETGLGVVADKVTKNLAIARQFVSEYGHLDFCGHRVDVEAKVVSVPKPPGVVLAVIPSTSPVAALYFKVLCAMLTRNAVVVSPHPLAAQTGVEATRVLAAAATSAGAPADVIQVLPKPTIPLVEAMMADKRTKLVLATGGGPVVQAAYRSGTPAIGVGPGNPPVVVDETADLANAAASIVDSKVFDHSVLCTAESVLFQIGSVASTLQAHLEQNGAYVCSPAETQKIRSFMYPGGKFNTKVVGRSAADIARGASIRVPQTARILVTPIDRVAEDEPLTHEKLSPVLAMRTVSDFAQAIREARALVGIVGIGHSAVIHSQDPQRVLDFSTALPVHRITVNTAGSLGNAGIGTGLPITMSVGTGFVGGSSSAENLSPEHFVQWSRTAYSSNPSVPFPDFSHLQARVAASGRSLNGATGDISADQMQALIREDLRRIVLEELRDLIGTR